MTFSKLLERLHLSRFVAFDFETTGLDPNNERIIEIAAVRYVNGKAVDRYVTLVNPEKNISDLISDITGITNKMVSPAPLEKDIVENFITFLGDDPLVAHNISFDLSFLKALHDRHDIMWIDHDTYDTLLLARAFLFDQPAFNLGTISEFFSLSTEGAHRAENDTENTGTIFLELIRIAAGYPLELMSRIATLIKSTTIHNRNLFEHFAMELSRSGESGKGLMEVQIHHDMQTNIFKNEPNKSVKKLTIYDIFNEGGILEKELNDFEYRSEQLKYCLHVEEALTKDPSIGVLEAGTGLGKTIAYLIPAIQRTHHAGKEGPTVISCYTKHLQDQLFHKDLQTVSGILNIPVKAVKLKGRNNYICLTRFNWLLKDAQKILNEVEITSLIPILVWLSWTKTGDLTECNGFWNSRPRRLGFLITSEPGFCTTKLCSDNNGCFLGKVRAAVFESDLIIINHALLLSELIQPGFLPPYDALIMDEAHNLIQVAHNQLTLNMDQVGLSVILDNIDPTFRSNRRWNKTLTNLCQIIPEITDLQKQLKDGLVTCRGALSQLFIWLTHQFSGQYNQDAPYREKYITSHLSEAYGPARQEINALDKTVRNLLKLIDQIGNYLVTKDPEEKKYPELHQIMQKNSEQLTTLLNHLIGLTVEQVDGWIYWQEGEFKKNSSGQSNLALSLHGCPIDISDPLSKILFNRIDHCVLTSATLKVDDSFDYFFRRTGIKRLLSRNIITAELSSPFLYEEQVKYLQYGGSQSISNDPESISQVILNSHKIHNKRTMVLFTSRNTLNRVYASLRSKKGGPELPIFAQRLNVSKLSLISGMKRTHNGIILGTSSFWEGVDLPGNLLEVLIIIKIPFDVPSEPVIKAYSNLLDSTGGNSFRDFSIPEAVIKLKQGFGRLIRTISDDGIFINLDNRVVTRSYGTHFSDTIPVTMQIFTNTDLIIP
jgi:predicted DnaQ family exonuclease/DinG family helicase